VLIRKECCPRQTAQSRQTHSSEKLIYASDGQEPSDAGKTSVHLNMETTSISPIKITRIENGISTDTADSLAIEEPLEIKLIYKDADKQISKNISVTMRTPGNDAELAAGFLFTENIIQNRSEIKKIINQSENNISIFLNDDAIPNLQNQERNFYTTSSCGVCGKSSIDAIKTISAYVNDENVLIVDPQILYDLPTKLRKQQEVFASTGGLHASAYFDIEGNFIALREDVGRHNALDKLIGYFFLSDDLPLNNGILLLSGRASFELIQKATMAGIKIIAAIGAPSSLAVQLAKEAGITLIGFLRDQRFNIYTS